MKVNHTLELQILRSKMIAEKVGLKRADRTKEESIMK